MFSSLLTKLVWFLWLFTLLFAWWFIPPRIDDGIYLFPAISVLNNYPPSGIINDLVQPIFYIFPTQPFFHGLFLKLLSFFSIEIGINTYRVFNYILLVVLFYLIYSLFYNLFSNPLHRIGAANISLILLGFSQFSTQFFVNRPEILGLVFFVLGLKFSVKFITSIKNSNLNISISLISFGLCAVVHPNFLILSIPIIIYLIWRMFIDIRIEFLRFLPLALIPAVIFTSWFFINFEVANDQFFARLSQASGGGFLNFSGIIELLSVIIGSSDNSLAHKIYLSAHMITLLILIICLLVCLCLRSQFYRGDTRVTNLFRFLSIAIFPSTS